MSLPDRNDVDPEYRFDLTVIYETPADWEDANAELEAKLDALEARAETPLQSADGLRALLERTEECYRRKQRLELYVNLANGVDRDDAPDWDRYHALESAFESSVTAVRRRIAETEGSAIDALVSELDDYGRYAENFREQARHVRSQEVEETLSTFDDVSRAPTDVVYAVWSDYDSPAVERPDGETVAVQSGNRRAELAHSDRDYRRRVHEAFWGELERFEETLATAYVAKLRAARAEARIRAFDSIRDRDFSGACFPDSGLRTALPEEIHDVMLEAVRENLGPYHRLLELRRDRLGVDDLRLWDLDVSLAGSDSPGIDYETAKSHVLEALAPLGDGYVEQASSWFDRRRIDVYPAEGKSDHAYCPSSATDGPFVLANFREDVRTTFALAHELGHVVAVEHHRQGPPRYAACPRPVGEVPAMTHELLLADHLVDRGGALADAALDRVLGTLGATLYRDAMVSAFTHDLATRIERGETVDADRIRATQRECLEEFRSPVTLGDDAGRTWLGRGTRPSYDSYSYVLGATGALAVRDGLRLGDLTVGEYRDFLRSTGRRSSVALFDRLGCDVTTSRPYERAAKAFDGYIDDATAMY